MIISEDQLRRECAQLGLEPDRTAVERFDRYAQLLIEWNQKINLTAITQPEQIVTRHFVDSLTFFSAADPAHGARLIDVGSGAGFPGLPLKILREDLSVTLLDGTGKRVRFLQEAASELGLTITAVHARAEDAAKDPQHRERYDFATARAVAALRELSEYCLGFVRPGGAFVAMKGPDAQEEIAAARHAVAVMGGEIGTVLQKTLSDGSGRTLVDIKKRSQTPTSYPRCSAKITKKPL